MKRELISDAAQGYVSRLYEEDEYPVGQEEIVTDVEQAFKDGARWRINSAWRFTAKELPECGRHATTEDWTDFIAEDERDLVRIIKAYGFSRWAYVEDLMPDKEDWK